MKINKFLFLLLIIMASCNSNHSELQEALSFSGKNRSELEKVLSHYQDDSLKYKATVFLIENMPYHSYNSDTKIDTIKNILSTIYNRWNLTEKEKQKGIFLQQNIQNDIKYDIQEVKADMLIENIDLAFKVWRTKPWNKHLPFDDFCELILPYRIMEEPLTRWRKKYYETYSPILDSLYQGTDVVEACNKLSDYLASERFYYFTDFSCPRQGADFQFNNRIGSCRDGCDIATYVMRSVGIPVSIDMYPYSPEYRIDHEWNVVRDTTGRYLSFWYGESNATRDNFTDRRKKGKVFRLCYRKQSNQRNISDIPPSLRNLFMKDVTDEYFGENTIEIPYQSDDKKNIFLGIFTARRGWLPVDIGSIEDNKMVFKNIEPFVIYQPLEYNNDRVTPIGYPFMFKKDSTHIFIPNKENERVILTRKYPLRKSIAEYKDWLKGVKIKASNSSDFTSSKILHTIAEVPFNNIVDIEIKDRRKYKYFQYKVPKDSFLSVAEIHFFTGKGEEILYEEVYSDGKPWKDIKLYQLENCYDNDPLSFFHAWERGRSIFFKAKEAQRVTSIQIVPRNDDNFIRIGDRYELYYNNGNKGWVSLGEQTALDTKLIYDVPQNSVLWLKNKTRGSEEQIFTYENGKQVFPTFVEYGK